MWHQRCASIQIRFRFFAAILCSSSFLFLLCRSLLYLLYLFLSWHLLYFIWAFHVLLTSSTRLLFRSLNNLGLLLWILLQAEHAYVCFIVIRLVYYDVGFKMRPFYTIYLVCMLFQNWNNAFTLLCRVSASSNSLQVPNDNGFVFWTRGKKISFIVYAYFSNPIFVTSC